MATVEIGSVFGGKNFPEKDGPILEFTRDEQNLVLRLTGISEQEAIDFQAKGAIHLALFEQKEVLFLLVKVTGVIDWSDAPYSIVTFSEDSWPAPQQGKQLKLKAILVEGSDRRVKAMREIELESSFSERLAANIETQKKQRIEVEEYLKRISSIQKRFKPEKMVQQGAAAMSI